MKVWDVAHRFLDEGSPEAELARTKFDARVGTLNEQGVLVRSLDEAEGIIWSIDNVNSGVSHHTWYLIPRDAILPIGRMRFEGHDVNVPHDYNRCLTDIFDDIYDVPEKVGSCFIHLNADALRDPEVREVMESLAGGWRNARV